MKKTDLKIGAVHISLSVAPSRRYDLAFMIRRVKRNIRKIQNRINIPGFTTPDELLIVSSHGYDDDYECLLETQMKRYSVPKSNYKIIKLHEEWSWFDRWKSITKYIKNHKAKYVLHCDALDVLFTDSPHNILYNFLNNFNCDLLYNSTAWRRDYRWDKMTQEAVNYIKQKPSRKRKNKTYRQRMEGTTINLNGGLFIGKKNYIIDIYKKVLSYEFDSKNQRDESTWHSHPEFPYGCANDQQILRHIEYENFPNLQVDHMQRLFARVQNLSELTRTGEVVI